MKSGRIALAWLLAGLLFSGCVTETSQTLEAPGGDVEATSGRSVDQILRDVAEQQGPATLEEAMALLDDRPAWQTWPPIEAGYLVRHPAEKFLEGMTFVLDPGHGGDASKGNWKQGPTGVREAEINLRVAKLLEKLLTDAGAIVHLTRDRDNDLSLADRAAFANRIKPDFFISLHHNAVDNPESNYGSVWYHGGVNTAGPELDLARHVALALGRHMRTQVAKSSPIFSDTQIYDTGFGVLRNVKVPAILCESSFYTDPAEEQRLRDAVYNLREAYAIYEGLCEYAYLGTPTQELTLRNNEAPTEPVSATAPSTAPSTQTAQREPRPPVLHLSGTLQTGLPEWWGHEKGRLIAPSVNVFADGARVDLELDPTTGEFSAALPNKTRVVRVYHENAFGHRNHPQFFALDPETLAMTPLPSPRLGRDNAPANQATPTTTAAQETPWNALPIKAQPILLHEGGDSRAQEIIDAIDLPEGSAMTVAGIDPGSGDVYALRWRGSGDFGFYPASTVKLATALMTLRQLHEIDPSVPFDQWNVRLEGDELTGEKAVSVETLLRDMIADSSNEAFNTLQEVAGFRETADFLASLGMQSLAIRRHFTRPHWNYSRAATLTAGEKTVELPARPGPDLPLNAAGGESNWSSTDDFVRLLAATFQGEVRERAGFETLASAMRQTNEPFIKRGLDEVGEGFVSYNKPGWYPLDGSHVDAAYVYDTTTGRHYYVSIYWQGPKVEESEENLQAPRQNIAKAIKTVFSAIREGDLRL